MMARYSTFWRLGILNYYYEHMINQIQVMTYNLLLLGLLLETHHCMAIFDGVGDMELMQTS